MLLLVLLSNAITPNPVVMSGRPLAPTRRVNTSQFHCAGQKILFHDFGEKTVSIRLNGRRLQGNLVKRFLSDLTSVSAVYRFSVGCDRSGEAITVNIVKGEQDNAVVRYQEAVAKIKAGRLVGYEPMKDTVPLAFWWR